MVFSSLTFLFIFLPITLLIYYISKDKYKNYVLLFFSLVFYSWGEPRYIILMILSIVLNYYFAILIDKYKRKVSLKKKLLVLTIVFNILTLFIFKYLGFFNSIFSNIFNTNNITINLVLPIGISFYTFQTLSYVIDVYRGEVKVQKNILLLATYVTLFPQLIAGPIVRYSTVEKELKKRKHSVEKFSNGLRRFIIGLSKKIIIANNMALIADTIFNSAISNNYTGIVLILGTLAYTFQIYFDFSGYSDMAIGLGAMFGFDFLENFNYPYVSKSITEFWRRWHISLSSWFRDYLYIPLGGNRVSKAKWIRNIIIVWILTGLWHGASWNFIIWGVYFAIILLIEKLFLLEFMSKWNGFVRWLYTFILINIGWIIFRAEDLNLLLYVFKNIFNFKSLPIEAALSINYSLLNYYLYIPFAFLFSFPIFDKINKKFSSFKHYYIIQDLLYIMIFIFCICLLISNTYNPFIYFRF